MNTKLEKINLKPGSYVLAVSGGVDSMVLLHLLAGRPGIELVVAHFNHGIRDDAPDDELLVKRTAKKLGLAYKAGRGKLGFSASEDQARRARYSFLQDVAARSNARAIITAHHQDDLIETAVINTLRGSGRRGLSAIKDNPKVLRPMIDVPKVDILAYAKIHKLQWLEDSTNQDIKYLRNYIRLQILPGLTSSDRSNLLKNIDKVAKNKTELDNLIATLSQTIIRDNKIKRAKFAILPSKLANEMMSFWLIGQGRKSSDRKTVERLSMALKTGGSGTYVDAGKGLRLEIGQTDAHFSNR